MNRSRRAAQAARDNGAMTLEDLEAWLDASSPRAPAGGVSMIDGFLAGIIVGPRFIPPDEWMWHVLGPHAEAGIAGTPAAVAIAAIVAHHNRIAETLAADPARYAPILMREDDGTVRAEDWAAGFYGAMRLRLTDWKPLLTTGFDAMAPLMPILVNCPDDGGVPLFGLMPKMIERSWVEEAWRHIPEAVIALRNYWMPHRTAAARAVG